MYLKIVKARKQTLCSECDGDINIGDTYAVLRAKLSVWHYISSKYHYHCLCKKIMQLFYFRKEKPRKPYPKRIGRPRIFVEADMKAVNGKWEKSPLTPIQKKRRAILVVQFHRAKELGRDISAIKDEMSKLGGIPKSWNQIVEPRDVE